jgi:mRNA-degrading endonuclease RelE of RelBE toxin-antitoxin system
MPPQAFCIKTTDFTDRYKRDYKGLSPELKNAAKSAIQMLKDNPHSTKIRLEKLNGYKNPSIYTIHINGHHTHKISFELQGSHAVFRRIGTHKEIDRDAR